MKAWIIQPYDVSYRLPYYVKCGRCGLVVAGETTSAVVFWADEYGWRKVDGVGILCRDCYNEFLDSNNGGDNAAVPE